MNRFPRRLASAALISALALSACSSSDTDDSGDNSGGTTAVPAEDGSTDSTATGNTASPATNAPDDDSEPSGPWPPADMCTILTVDEVQALTGETLDGAPVPDSGEFAFGPYCSYVSAASGLFMTISSFTPEDLFTFTEGFVVSGQAVELSGIGDSAILELIPGINDARVYVEDGERAFSVQIVSFSDNGWTPEIVTQIASDVATAIANQ